MPKQPNPPDETDHLTRLKQLEHQHETLIADHIKLKMIVRNLIGFNTDLIKYLDCRVPILNQLSTDSEN